MNLRSLATVFLLLATPLVRAEDASLDEWLELSGWTEARLADAALEAPLSAGTRKELLDLAERFRRLPDKLIDTADNASDSASPGSVVSVTGSVIRCEQNDSAGALVRVQLPDGDGEVAVLALAAPGAWFDEGADAAGQPVALRGLVVGWSDTRRLVVAPRVRWSPTVADGAMVNYGDALLGGADVDIGLLDELVDGKPLTAGEAAPFYHALSACQSFNATQLLRAAGENLPRYAKHWEGLFAEDGPQRRLAAAVVQQTREGRYAVAPLFNDAVNQRGQLVAMEGVARRAVRIDLSLAPDGGPSRVPEQYGIDHYYELELFPPDSQNLPLVFCLLELPNGFPTGDAIQEPVRVAGFFLKRWAYRTRQTVDGQEATDLRQLAPLLVGRGPVWLPSTPPERGTLGPVLAGLGFVGLIGAIAYWLRRQAAADRRFERSTLARYKTGAPPANDQGQT